MRFVTSMVKSGFCLEPEIIKTEECVLVEIKNGLFSELLNILILYNNLITIISKITFFEVSTNEMFLSIADFKYLSIVHCVTE